MNRPKAGKTGREPVAGPRVGARGCRIRRDRTPTLWVPIRAIRAPAAVLMSNTCPQCNGSGEVWITFPMERGACEGCRGRGYVSRTAHWLNRCVWGALALASRSNLGGGDGAVATALDGSRVARCRNRIDGVPVGPVPGRKRPR